MSNQSDNSVDIVVVGGGMAGVMAALAAKTERNRVLIVEPSNVLGGQGTAGGVAGFCGDTERVNREFADLIRRLMTVGVIEPYRPNDDRRAYDLEWCAFFLQEMVVERGIEVLLHSTVVGVKMDRGLATGLSVATTAGLMEIATRFVVDASGLCVVPKLADFPVVHEGANRQLPMSLYFTMWDTGKPVTPALPPGCPRWQRDDEIPMTSLHYFPTGKVEVKMKVVGFDAADPKSRSAAEMFARRQMHALIYFLQTIGYRGRKLDRHVLASVSRYIGAREERRIVGEHILTEQEARHATIFPDAVAVNTYHIDFHWPDRMQRANTGITDMLEPHHLPLRMMIPKGARNVLVPGKGSSGDQKAMSAYRVMAVVAQMGYGAGHAARQCLETGTDLTTIDVPKLQAAIEAGGQSLNLSDYGDYLRCDLFAREAVLPEGEDFSGCSAPAILQGTNGRFLIAWCGVHGRAGKPGLWLAERREKRWIGPRLLAEFPTILSRRVWMVKDGPSALRIVFEVGTAAAAKLWSLASVDGGVSWGAAQPLEKATRPEQLKLADGGRLRLVAAEGVKRSARVEFSGDDGATWTAGAALELAKGGEPAMAVLEGGTLALVFSAPGAGGGSLLTVALSGDRGSTWSHRRAIEPETEAFDDAAIAGTLTGLAIATMRGGAKIQFWHGSVERIIHGPPTKQAHTDVTLVQ